MFWLSHPFSEKKSCQWNEKGYDQESYVVIAYENTAWQQEYSFSIFRWKCVVQKEGTYKQRDKIQRYEWHALFGFGENSIANISYILESDNVSEGEVNIEIFLYSAYQQHIG